MACRSTHLSSRRRFDSVTSRPKARMASERHVASLTAVAAAAGSISIRCQPQGSSSRNSRIRSRSMTRRSARRDGRSSRRRTSANERAPAAASRKRSSSGSRRAGTDGSVRKWLVSSPSDLIRLEMCACAPPRRGTPRRSMTSAMLVEAATASPRAAGEYFTQPQGPKWLVSMSRSATSRATVRRRPPDWLNPSARTTPLSDRAPATASRTRS